MNPPEKVDSVRALKLAESRVTIGNISVGKAHNTVHDNLALSTVIHRWVSQQEKWKLFVGLVGKRGYIFLTVHSGPPLTEFLLETTFSSDEVRNRQTAKYSVH